jgi:GT2 family glycosyltransferase
MSLTALDIIIVTYNTRAETLACLDTLASAPPETSHQIIVVDNASHDGTTDAIRRRHPRVVVMPLSDNRGFGAANNVALRASSAPLVLFLNSDTQVGRGAIDRLVDRLATTGAAVAGPRITDETGRPEVSFGPMLSPSAELLQFLRQRMARSGRALARRYIERLLSREREVDWVSGACLLARREAVAAAGLFDERYFLYEEDVDLCAAIRAAGGRVIYTPHAHVVHLLGRSPASAAIRKARYDRSHLAFYDKHAPGWAPALRWWLRLRGRRVS